MSAETGLPFIMDMRDPWSHQERLMESVASPLWFSLARYYERKSINRASLVIANTEVARRQLIRSYPLRQADILTVTNGADDEPLPLADDPSCFSIAHAGTVYLDRNPRPLLEAAARFVRERGLTPAQFRVRFMGNVEDSGGYPLTAAAAELGVTEFVDLIPPADRDAALRFQASSPMLLTMSGTNMAAIPAKTFEAGRFPAWLLALSAPGSATALLLEGTEADVAAPDDVEGILAILRKRYDEFAAGVRPVPVGADPRFSRREQARILFEAIEARVGTR